MSEWQPIETAPKDGTRIIAADSHGVWMAEWKPEFQSGYRPENPWSTVLLNHWHINAAQRGYVPTHWMPLPAPPAEGQPT